MPFDPPHDPAPADRDDRFSSTWGLLAATAGVAIGLGNVWRFPYMMGRYGGSAFLVVYLAVIVLFGLPALMAEMTLGRATRRGPLGALRAVGLPGAGLWGSLLVVTVTMAASYYGVVIAWVVDFLVRYLVGATGAAAGAEAPGALFGRLVGSFTEQLAALVVVVGLSCLALAAGVRRGIERVSRLALPLFFFLFLVLLVRVLTLDGAMGAVADFLVPRFGEMGPESYLAALGQAFFSLALGGTFMVVYGAYLPARTSIPRVAGTTAAVDVAAALVAGLAVVPAVAVFGLDLASGPSLLFDVLPEVFARLPAGRLFAVAFFAAVALVALLSLMAAYEVMIEAATRHFGWSRSRAVVSVGLLELVLGIPALLSLRYLETSDLLWGSTMQPLGGAVAVVALVWSFGRARALEEMSRGGALPAPSLLVLWLRWVVPGGILTILVYGWWERLGAG